MVSEQVSTSTSAPKASVSATGAPTHRDPALDGLRGLAILLVFLFHYGGGLKSAEPSIHALGLIAEAGWVGIVLFFALSGFLITGSLWETVGQRHRLRNFYVRRALRIFPLYFVALLAAAVFAVARGTTFAELKPLGIFVFFLQDMPHIGDVGMQFASPLPLYHLWTVAVEVQFYLVWPLILLLAHSRRHALRLSLWLFGLTELFLYIVYTMDAFKGARAHQIYDKFFLTHTAALALGAAVGLAMGNRASPTGRKPGSHRIVRKWATLTFWIGIALFLWSSYHSQTFYLRQPIQFWLGLPGISLSAAAAIPMVLRTGLPRKVFSFAPLGWMGRISYGFYIFHILLEPLYNSLAARAVSATTGEEYQTTRFLIAFALTTVISWGSFRLFESPILSLKRFLPMRQELPWGEPIDTTVPVRRRRSKSKS